MEHGISDDVPGDRASTLPARSINDPVARCGRAIGAMFFAGFGTVWLALAASSTLAQPAIAVTVIVVLGLALAAWAWSVVRIHWPVMRAAGQTPESKRGSRLFNWINAGQWIVIFLLGIALSSWHRTDLILPMIILVVGIHFIPLAHLFRYRMHYLTGAAMIALALLYPVLAADGGRSVIGPAGAGIILWASAIRALIPFTAA